MVHGRQLHIICVHGACQPMLSVSRQRSFYVQSRFALVQVTLAAGSGRHRPLCWTWLYQKIMKLEVRQMHSDGCERYTWPSNHKSKWLEKHHQFRPQLGHKHSRFYPLPPHIFLRELVLTMYLIFLFLLLKSISWTSLEAYIWEQIWAIITCWAFCIEEAFFKSP